MKLRADIALVEQGLAPTRARAQALILAGKVYCGDRRVEKSGIALAEGAILTVKGLDPYVSRGGHKLAGALKTLAVTVTDLVAVDVGASTGGFTDCLLQHGARLVYAVDVGHGQLAEKLRQDPRVVSMERTNARDLTPAHFPEAIQLVVVDASFIGIEKLMPAIAGIAVPGTRLLALIKPQFEAGREEATRGRGVISDPQVREAAIERGRAAVRDHGFRLIGECDSEVRGPKGNLERFVFGERLLLPA